MGPRHDWRELPRHLPFIPLDACCVSSRTLSSSEAHPMLTRAIVVALVLVASPAFAQAPATNSPVPVISDVAAASPQETAAPPAPALASLFLDLGKDFRHLPSRDTAVILGTGGALAIAVRHEDVDVTRRAAGSHPIDEAFDAGEVIGSGIAQFGLAFGTYALGRVQHSARVSWLGADLVRAQLVNTALTQGIKFVVQRDRPDGGRYSFPSGHTSATFATATVLQRHLGWKAGVPAYAVSAYAAASRLPENKHYLSDVIFGAAIGVVSGRTVTVGHGKVQFAVSPLAGPLGGGIGLTLVGAG